MIITANSGNGNLSNYLLYGNNNSRDRSKIVVLDGNAKLTDSISKSVKADDKHFHFIVSANGKKSDEEMRAIYQDFKKELLHSYSKDEVNVLAILHQDTQNNSHIHIQVPKKNLLTNTKLDLYYDKRDRRRFETIRDYLNLKYNETPPSIPSKSNPTKNWQYNPIAIKNKKEKLEFENMLLDNLYDNRDKFTSHEELMQYIKEDLKVDIKKIGYDYNRDDFYLTTNHSDTNKSQRVFSPLFNNGKSKYTTSDNGEKNYIQHDFSTIPLEKQREIKKEEDLQTLRAKLDKMQAVEKKRIDKRLGRMKPLAVERTESAKNEHQPLPIKKIEPSSPKYEDLKKESSLENRAEEFQLLQDLQQINLAEIATREFNFKFTQREDSFDVIEDKKTQKKLFIHKDNNGYKYINPYNKRERGDIANFLQKSAKVGMYGAMLEMMNPLKAYLSIFKDLVKIGEMVLDATLDSFLEKNLLQRNELNSFKKTKKTKLPHIKGTDLKPF